ncbi:MAG: hypothetical protein EXS37_00995 [Opitutus sp.]|nr:hypothetical protein [Opitutus sp.]
MRLLRHVLLRRLGRAESAQQLKQSLATAKDRWAKALGRYLAGELDEPTLLAEAARGDDSTFPLAHSNSIQQRLSGAFFYAGMSHLLGNETDLARKFFKRCTALNLISLTYGPTHIREVALARAELARLSAPR